MTAVLFQVTARPGQAPRYFELAAQLREELEQIDGFISIERFQSLTDEGKVLSLSFWRDEAAAAKWRSHAEHRRAQSLGKREVFADFRITVAEVARDYTMAETAPA